MAHMGNIIGLAQFFVPHLKSAISRGQSIVKLRLSTSVNELFGYCRVYSIDNQERLNKILA